MSRNSLTTLLAATFVAFAASTAAIAADRGGGTEATALQGAKLSLIDAIKIAEQQTGGQAYDAGVAKADRHVRIMVETNGPKGIQTVAIDAQSGQVVATHAGGEPD